MFKIDNHHAIRNLKYVDFNKFKKSTRNMSTDEILEIIEYAIDDYPRRICLASEAWTKKEKETVIKTIHNLIGSLSYLHADRILIPLRELETIVKEHGLEGVGDLFRDFRELFKAFIIELEEIKEYFESMEIEF